MGTDPDRVITAVRDRIAREGALLTSEFEHTRRKGQGGWWEWSPEKAALEYLWRIGELAIDGRVDFHKRYDLSERVFPGPCALPRPTAEDHAEWACSSALERLGTATPTEIAAFWRAVSIDEAKKWCVRAAREGRLVPVQVTPSKRDKRPWTAWAVCDWRARLDAIGATPDRIRLLAPFDPVLRDRGRALRLLGADVKFEAFVPAEQRTYGYYVMAGLERTTRMVRPARAKVSPRSRGARGVRGVWWEPGVRVTQVRARRLEEAVARLAQSIGADQVQWPTTTRRRR